MSQVKIHRQAVDGRQLSRCGNRLITTRRFGSCCHYSPADIGATRIDRPNGR
jgi:hypothetical protein